MSAPARKVKYHEAAFIGSQNKRESEKIELLNSPIYSSKVSYAWQTLLVASIISQHLSLSLSLFPQSLLLLSPFTFSVPPSPLSVSALTAVSSISLNRHGPCRPCWGVESSPSLEDPEIRPLSANPTQYQGAPRSSSSL